MHLMTTKVLLAVAPETLGLHIAPRNFQLNCHTVVIARHN